MSSDETAGKGSGSGDRKGARRTTTATSPKVGWFRPADLRPHPVPAPDASLVRDLRGIAGLSAAVSDVLDSLGFRLCVPASQITPVAARGAIPLVGRVVTLRYLPVRDTPGPEEANGRLAYGTAFDVADVGDVVVISAPRDLPVSVLGGNAMAAARAAGVVGAIADAFVRDVDEIEAVGLPVWAAGVTAISGRGRLEAVAINGPVEIRGVHVHAGDVVVADASGIAFVPADQFGLVADQLLRKG
jgi:regulator of RNase E activity RraA